MSAVLESVSLPALRVSLKGEVTDSNVPQFKAAVKQYCGAINKTLREDEDFAQAEIDISTLSDNEKKAIEALNSAIAQTTSIDQMKRTVEFVIDEMRLTRLTLTRLVKDEKERKKNSILEVAQKHLRDHIVLLEGEISKIYPVKLLSLVPDFNSATKGRRNFVALKAAVNDELDRCMVSADRADDDVRYKLMWMKANKSFDLMFLFRDLQILIQKPREDFQAQVILRTNEHEEKEKQRAEIIRQEAEQKANEKLRKNAEADGIFSSIANGTTKTETKDVDPEPQAVPRTIAVQLVESRYFCEKLLTKLPYLEITQDIREAVKTFLKKTSHKKS